MEPRASQHQEKCEGNNSHVSKVEGRLKQSIHATSVEVVKERVGINENTSHACIDKCSPPPSVIFSGKLEVEQCHADKGSHNEKKDEGKEKDSKECVHLVSPHGSKDVMKLNVDC